MQLIIPNNTKNEISVKGFCRGFQTYLDKDGKDTGIIVSGTNVPWHQNTLGNDLKYYLAYKIATDTTDQAMDALFTGNGAVAGLSAQNGKDGIAHGAGGTMDYLFTTTKNVGGTNAEAYVEFYGYVDGAATLTSTLYLGFNYVHATYELTKKNSSVSINQTVASGRRYHHYWKITVS